MELSKAGKSMKSQTGLHRRVCKIIQAAGFYYVEEFTVPSMFKYPYSLDFYLPEFHVGVEADGPYHNQEKDEVRDKWIMDTTGIVLIRFSEHVLRTRHLDVLTRELVVFCDTNWYTKNKRVWDSQQNK